MDVLSLCITAVLVTVCLSERLSHKTPVHLAVQLQHSNDTLAEEVAKRHGLQMLGKIGDLPGYYYFGFTPQHKTRRKKREAHEILNTDSEIIWSNAEIAKVRVKRDVKLPWRDPYYSYQWYLNGKAQGGYDMKVREAWRMGMSGKGVTVTILDDGIQYDHPDLKNNYDSRASTDINSHDSDPMPQDNGYNDHGTRCAGVVSSQAGNGYCGVGIAYNANIGGIRMLDGRVTDSVEAGSLSFNQQHIDIYSSSWGPEDDGRTVDGPAFLAAAAFLQGIRQGRGGKGNIFVWAGGNGGTRDSCACDGYTNNIFTVSINSATSSNKRPWYLEECPAIVASTYSSGRWPEPAVASTTVPSGCTTHHTGTSASAPMAAAIIALALEANRRLTWRDIQHIVLRSADPTVLQSNTGWMTNGVGRKVHHQFGYGLMDAEAMVQMALDWKPLPTQQKCKVRYEMRNGAVFLTGSRFKRHLPLRVTGCCLNYLEHVEAMVSVTATRRGSLRLSLISPMGTKSVLLPPRRYDSKPSGYHRWSFLTIQQWGESPHGKWTLIVENIGSHSITAKFDEWSLTLYGTKERAQSMDNKHKSHRLQKKSNCQNLCGQSGCF